jgi:hypothetical protein
MKKKPQLFGPQMMLAGASKESLEALLKNNVAAPGSALEQWIKEELKKRQG